MESNIEERLNKDERIQLRDELFDKFLELKIIIFSKHFNTYQFVNKKSIVKKINNNIDLLNKYNKYINNFESINEALYCLLHKDDWENHLCSICKKRNPFYNIQHGYRNTCGDKNCIKRAVNNEQTRHKIENTNLKKYGYKVSSQAPEVKAKAIKTFITNWGYINSSQHPIIKNKVKQTCLKKYGCTCPLQNDKIHAKTLKTWQEKYNTDHPFKSPEIKAKCLKSFIRNHGISNPISEQEIKKIIELFKIIYKKRILEKADLYINEQLFKNLILIKYIEKNRLLRLNEIAKLFKVSNQTIRNKCRKLNLLQYFFIPDSKLELQFAKLLDINNIKYKRRLFSLNNEENNYHQQIDFILNDYDIGFEINDLTNHNVCIMKSNYHLNKKIKAKNQLNIRLIHIWEWEITDSNIWDKLSKWILNILNDSKIQINIKDCEIKLVNSNKQIDFLNKYHLNGYEKSDICLGLYHNNKLLQIISFIQNNNKEYQLSQICTKFEYDINYKKLLDYFISNYNPQSIIAYCDLDKFTGNTYKELGFKLLKSINPFLIWYNQSKKEYLNHLKEYNNIPDYKKVYNCGANIYIMQF